VLATSAHFRALSAECIVTLAAAGRVRTFDDGSLVHAPGMPGSALMVVLEGSLHVTSPSSHGAGNTLAILERGSFQNVQAALGTPDTQAEIHAFGPTRVAVFSRTRLVHVVREFPELDSYFKRMAVDRIAALVGLFSDLVSQSLERRLARRLLAQSMTSDPDAQPVKLHATHAMLGAMVRASRGEVSTTLKAWERRALLRLGYRGIVVEDMRGLRRVAGPAVRPL
jgi:CRP-like cAMP-binding protein